MIVVIGIVVVIVVGIIGWLIWQRQQVWKKISTDLSIRGDVQILDMSIGNGKTFINLAKQLTAPGKIMGIVKNEKQAQQVKELIDQRLRKQGVGTKTMEFIIGQLPKLTVDTIVAYIFGHNIPSLKLFKSFGFTQWGLLPQVAELDGIKRDLVILGRHFK